jgi:signal transduction histidine kinase
LIGEMVDRSRAQASVHRLNGVLRSVRDINQLIVRERTPGSLIRTACSLLVEDRSYASALIILTGETGAVTDYAQAGMDAVFPPLQRLLDEGGLPPCCERIGTGETVSVLFDPVSVCQSCPISETCRGEGVMRARLSHGGEAFGFLAVAGDGDLGVDHEEQELFLEMAGDLGYALHTMAAHRAREAAERARERAEEHLHQTQRLESVGRLAGGVAHDFNNLLTGILNYVELCRDEIEPTHPIQEYLEEITRDAQRSADLTRQLLAFARRQTVAPRVLDLNDTVVGMLSMLRRLIGEDVDLAWQPCVDVWPVKIDPSQMDQILVNLCVNARDAINGVGRVTIETANTVVPPEYCMEHVDAVPGEYVTLAVSDDGCGMDEQTRLQVFEPFFSTKPTGEGTGLGLATVYGIVRQNGGFAGVYSEEGSGTTFRVYLPRSMADTTTHGAREADTTTSAGGTETLLLVEDEKSIRVTMGLFLRKRGYTVLEAASPEEALRLIAEYRGRVHLLITDVVMPGMSGRDLAERVMADDGQLRVLYMSGYTANVIAHRGILEDGVDFLSKPIDRQDLTRKVREILDR